MRSIFISYSHQDKKWLEELQLFLRPLERNFPIIPWEDTRIKPGEDWQAAIDQAMSQSDIALVLVTQDFLASDYIAKNELPYLQNKQRRGELFLIPLILKTSNAKTVAKDLLALQGYGSPDRPLAELDEAERLKQYAALSEHLVEISPAAKPSKSKDLAKKHRIEPREYALSVYIERQGEDWITHYRVPGNEAFLTTHRPSASSLAPRCGQIGPKACALTRAPPQASTTGGAKRSARA